MRKLYLLLYFCMLLLVGCDEQSVDITYNNAIEIPTESLNVQMDGDVYSQTIEFTAIADWEISLSETTKAIPDWISVSPMSGSAGDVILTIETTENLEGEPRSASIAIMSNGEEIEINVTQEAVEATLSISVATQSVESSEGSFDMQVFSNTDWTTSGIPTWVTLSPTSGNGDKSVTVSYAENSELESRSATITFSNGVDDRELTITQAGVDPSLSISKSSESVEYTSGSFTLDVSSNTDWTTSDVPSWVTLSPSSGNGDTTVSVSYTANTDTESRSATITFSCSGISKTLTITQAGEPVVKDWSALSYTKRVMGIQCTATWCGFCPRVTGIIHNFEEQYGEDRAVFVSAHGSDVMSNNYSSYILTELSVTSYPSLYIGSIQTSTATNVDGSVANLFSAIVSVENKGVATAITASSTKSSSTISISATVAVKTSGKYGVGAMVVEDDIVATQSSYYSSLAEIGLDGYDISNHVNVLQACYPTTSGTPYVNLGDQTSHTANTAYNFDCSFSISSLTSLSNINNCRIIVYTYNIATGYIDNVIQAPIGTTRDFDYK